MEDASPTLAKLANGGAGAHIPRRGPRCGRFFQRLRRAPGARWTRGAVADMRDVAGGQHRVYPADRPSACAVEGAGITGPMRTEDLDFELPRELIAQTPAQKRSDSRLLRYRRADCTIEHRRFSELPRILRPGDLLVFNDSRVVPARFTLRKPAGGLVEGLFVAQEADGAWRVMLKNVGRRPAGMSLAFVGAEDIGARITEVGEAGEFVLEVDWSGPAVGLLERVGRMPLPPYIRRQRVRDPRDATDRERYQTVYAREDGSIAAPTAGLHFTPQLLDELSAAGVEMTFVTLHVGAGTFRPVSAPVLEQHRMHAEQYTIPAAAAEAVNRARAQGRRIIAVGTTSARVLESQPDDRPVAAVSGSTSLFIYPPYRWKYVGGLITNFHLPRSTLIALVAAMMGLEQQKRAYRVAVECGYRFFSYGDAMMIE